MNLKPAILLKKVPKFAVFGLVPFVLLLVAMIFKILSSFFLTFEQVTNQPIVSEIVKVVDSSTVSASRNGIFQLIPGVNVRIELPNSRSN